MALRIGDEWIRSDRCPQVAMAVTGGWVLSWRRGLWTREEAIIAMIRAEGGDLVTHPAAAGQVSSSVADSAGDQH